MPGVPFGRVGAGQGLGVRDRVIDALHELAVGHAVGRSDADDRRERAARRRDWRP